MDEKLGCFEFGRQLLETNDLDPVYVLLWEAGLSGKHLRRWLLAYWCYYHVGTASWISDRKDQYWTRMYKAAGSKTYPRGRERRHFRGDNALKSVRYLESVGVERLLAPLREPQTAEQAMRSVRDWVGFGPWIAFKVADMLERLNLGRIRFSERDVYLFDSPRKGAEELRESLEPGLEVEGRIESWAVRRILSSLSGKAPPRYERRLGVQEAETVLCKWHSYLGGHYRVGEDVEGCRKMLKFLPCGTSRRLRRAGRRTLWE